MVAYGGRLFRPTRLTDQTVDSQTAQAVGVLIFVGHHLASHVAETELIDGFDPLFRMHEALDGDDRQNWSDEASLPEVRQYRSNQNGRCQMGQQQHCEFRAMTGANLGDAVLIQNNSSAF
jgi:hypothetical protein